MTDGNLWKIHRAFAVKHLKLLGLGQKRTDELIREEYGRMVDKLEDRLSGGGGVTPGPDLQSAVMNVLWELTANERFEDPALLALMKKRGAAFDMAGGLLNQIPWIRYVAPVATGYSLLTEINRHIYTIISVSVRLCVSVSLMTL